MSDDQPIDSFELEMDGKQVGFITSSVKSPILGKTLALGYIKAPNTDTDQEVNIKSQNTAVKGKIIQLPLTYK